MSKRPWGEFFVLFDGKNFKVKLLRIFPNSKTSLQYHNHREEVWVVVNGEGEAIVGGKKFKIKRGDMVKVGKKEVHRIINNSKEVLEIVEVWIGEVLEEKDIDYCN